MGSDVYTRNVLAVAASVAILTHVAALAFLVFMSKRHEFDKSVLWAVMLWPFIGFPLVAVGGLIALFGESETSVIAAWAFAGAGMLGLVASSVLFVMYWLRQRAQQT